MMNSIPLKYLFNSKDLNTLTGLIKKNNFKDLRIFLNSEDVSKNLEDKGVLPDYLYYFLEYKFQK